MARIYLHIGIEKTGTTSLQAFLAANEAALRASGLSYLADPAGPYFERIAHGPVAASLLAERPDFVSAAKYRPADEVLEALRRDVDHCGCDVILSCEQFSSRVTSPSGLRKLADALSGHEVKVVCYLRRQDELAVAAYSTAVRCGRRTPLTEDEIIEGGWYYDFLRMLDLWAGAFGAENLIVRSYDLDSLLDHDIRCDFLALVGVANMRAFVFGEDRNASLDARQVEVLRLINQSLPTWEDPTSLSFEWGNKLRALIDPHLPKGEALNSLLGSDARRRVMERFAPANRVLEARYMTPGALAGWFAPMVEREGAATRPVDPLDLTAVVAEVAGQLAEAREEVARLQMELRRPRRHSVRAFMRSLRKMAALSIGFALLLDPIFNVLFDLGLADTLDLAQMLS